MIESHWKHQRQHKQQDQHTTVFCPDYQQKEEANHENHELGRDHICQNSAHKKAVLTLEKREAVWAVMPYVKRVCDDL
jgi:hypothetical protein